METIVHTIYRLINAGLQVTDLATTNRHTFMQPTVHHIDDSHKYLRRMVCAVLWSYTYAIAHNKQFSSFSR